MRAILLVLIVAVIAIIIAFATGFLTLGQVRGGKAPQVAATTNGITAKGGQAPAFDVQTGSVKIGSKQANVKVPTLVVEPPGNRAAAATNNAQ